jgi:NAD(P)-dependent dehydrogenase (short-subunit alcohol dehydrogenase family)
VGVFDGKVAIVTGAGRGIGRSHALLLASEGAAVVVNDLGGSAGGEGADATPAQEVVAEITAKGGRAVANHDSVSSWTGAQALVERAVSEFGRLDVLVNNAGILRDKMSFNMDEAEWDAVIDVHLKGHFAPSRFAAAHWRAQAKATGEPVGAAIVNTASESGLYGNAGQANYAAAKAGLVGLSRSVARELARRSITCNVVAPGPIVTAMTADMPDEWRTQAEQAVPLARFGTPEECAAVITFLCSDAASYVTGAVVPVDGGLGMGL